MHNFKSSHSRSTSVELYGRKMWFGKVQKTSLFAFLLYMYKIIVLNNNAAYAGLHPHIVR